VLQTGYNNIFGATRLVFSPDGKLLATGTFRSNTIKLWETATNRKLRDLSSSGQTAPGLAPSIAFSRDSRLVAASAADNSIKVWDVNSGREVQTLTGPQGTIGAGFGVYFIGFASDNRLVSVSDAARVWDLNTGRELRTIDLSAPGAGYTGTEGGMAISPDGTQFVMLDDDSEPQARVIDLASGREVRRVKLSDKHVDTISFTFTPDGRVLAAGVVDKRLKLWDVTAKKEQELAQTTKE
jgi:WD40 repeat protein